MLKEGIFLGKRYEILERIGSGGMADVYKGKDHKLNRFVAVKVLKSDYRSDEVFIQKFLSEAQAAAGLMHPNVVNVYDVGQDRGLYYMVMELVEGISLKDYIEKKGQLSAKETISISIQMVTGIQAAHNQHIIHRDIKPQNIIISKDGKVKVTDFGIARATTSTNTISTNVMGSVHYTSPEQARGGIVDEKSDIYSAGITMYEMITGHVPFDGDSTVAVAIKHLREEIKSPSEEVPDIPYSLECIIMKCTQKNTTMRYQNCQELINDLKRSLVDPNGNFVNIPGHVGGDATVVMSEDELRRVQDQSYDQDDYDDDDDDDYGDDYDNDYDDDYDDDDYDQSDYDDDDYDDRAYDSRQRRDGKNGRKNGVDPNTRKIMKILLVVAIAVFAIGTIFVIGQAAGMFKSNPKVTDEKGKAQVTVPDILGMTVEEATETLNKKGLGLSIAERAYSDKYEKGEIMEQKTAANKKVDKNTEIQVVVSNGEEILTVAVPDVSGQSESAAQKTLEDANLVVDSESKYDDHIEAGKVISTDPAAGMEVEEGTHVKMYVSMGVEKVEVPQITGITSEEAQAALAAVGLIGGSVTEEYSEEYDAGYVISQGKSAGSKLEKGSAVDYVVSKGSSKVEVPDLYGMTMAEAQQALSDLGLVSGAVTSGGHSDLPEGQVMSQTIAPGSHVDRGTAIDFQTSDGPEVVPIVPSTPDNGGSSGSNNSGSGSTDDKSSSRKTE
ncbi:Stk1 family PASTA domain-containing Ser/Thr kinase [Mediterraneibacter glycyrrhizinilyticus]|uniref:Stk1 family PASTA domain-containing Ser/Thr kinase n=1 Tax=Mediterraneibacter glycyrrhizinilyticus TaxID=342942 RepID=UPI00189FF79F|nr:Stk1 family PASTA domain-containing Ser/Thr kinase [Mediterraneibacter glycyrrhizinilyticus]